MLQNIVLVYNESLGHCDICSSSLEVNLCSSRKRDSEMFVRPIANLCPRVRGSKKKTIGNITTNRTYASKKTEPIFILI